MRLTNWVIIAHKNDIARYKVIIPKSEIWGGYPGDEAILVLNPGPVGGYPGDKTSLVLNPGPVGGYPGAKVWY